MGLFSTVYHNHTTTEVAVPYEKTVIENRALTDDSIRLADEYTQKTQERFMSSFKLETNTLGKGLNANVFMFLDERVGHLTASPCIKYITRFRLNNKDFEFEFKLDSFEVQELSRQDLVLADREILVKVIDKISKYISVELLQITGTKSIGLKHDYNLK